MFFHYSYLGNTSFLINANTLTRYQGGLLLFLLEYGSVYFGLVFSHLILILTGLLSKSFFMLKYDAFSAYILVAANSMTYALSLTSE